MLTWNGKFTANQSTILIVCETALIIIYVPITITLLCSPAVKETIEPSQKIFMFQTLQTIKL